MTNRFLVSIVAMIAIIGLVLSGCPTTLPVTDPAPIELTVLVRTEDARKQIGEYLATVVEDLGFEATIRYGTSAELSPIWLADPAVQDWNAYTGGWSATPFSLDDGWIFGGMYTNLWSAMGPLWAAYGNDQVYFEQAERLWNNDFKTMEERRGLFEECLIQTMRDSVRIFLHTRAAIHPLSAELGVASDAAGGIAGSTMWGFTLHRRDDDGQPVPGGTVKAATTDILTNPWNPVAGSNWLYDMFPIRATGDGGLGFDTTTGLRWPNKIEKAEVYVQTGYPVAVTNTDWVSLTFVPKNDVPADAWADWNAATQQFIPAGAGKTSVVKSVAYYPEGTFDVPLHDGSTFSLADILYYTILLFDRSKVDSAIYDQATVSGFTSFMQVFKGVKFITDEPGYDLIVEYYTDYFDLDAELSVATMFPYYAQGPAMWHTLAMAIKGEADGKLAFGQTKSTAVPAENRIWTSFIAGEGLAELKSQLAGVIAAGSTYAPYQEFIAAEYTARDLGDFGAEIAERYANLDAFVTEHNHFWVASGPMYLDSVSTTPKSVVLKRFEAYPDDADRWLFLMGLEETGLGHRGAWVDQVTVEVELVPAQAVSRLKAGDLDLYAFGIADAGLAASIQADPNLYAFSMTGLFDEITFNPVGPIHPETGKVNPFALKAVREAMNWAVDRNFIVGTIMGGLAIPQYTALNPPFADAAVRYPDIIAVMNAAYAYDFEKADQLIEDAMLAIPGVTRVDGKYFYLEPQP